MGLFDIILNIPVDLFIDLKLKIIELVFPVINSKNKVITIPTTGINIISNKYAKVLLVVLVSIIILPARRTTAIKYIISRISKI
jgi:hypothetical protein